MQCYKEKIFCLFIIYYIFRCTRIGGKLTGFRIIAQEALQRMFNKDFDLKKLKFVDDIMNLSETYKEDQFTFTVKHYCVTKPTDYLLRRTHISWFNENGGIKSLKKITDKFYSNTNFIHQSHTHQGRGR